MKKPKIIVIIFILLFVATVGVIISMSDIDKQTEEETTFYTATVMNVDVADTGKNIFVKIRTQEFQTYLYISTNIGKSISIEEVRNLKNGQTIFFGIENKYVQQMNKVEFVSITSLKTETKDIFSLEEYNKYIKNSAYPVRIASIVAALLFFCFTIFLFKNQKKQ